MNTVTRDLYGEGTSSCYKIPYVIMQERVKCNHEVKMVFLNKRFSHMVSGGSSLKKSFPGHDTNALIAFGNSIIARIAEIPKFVTDGVIRVDVFYSLNHDKLVLNELESLEAAYYSTDTAKEDEVLSFLQFYWECKIYESFANVCNRSI